MLSKLLFLTNCYFKSISFKYVASDAAFTYKVENEAWYEL